MPTEISSRREVLKAIEGLPTLAELLEQHDGHYRYELDLEVCVYGRNYQGKQVGPYIRLLSLEPGETIIRQGDWGGNTFYVGVDLDLDVYIKSRTGDDVRVGSIPSGRQFGEMSVLAGVPRAASVRVPDGPPVRVLEIQRPALRLLRKIPFFRNSLDVVYHHHGRMAAFQKMSISPELSEAMLLDQNVGFSRFQVLSKNHVLFREGAPIEELYFIKEGWLRRTAVAGSRDYLGRGYCFGLEAAHGECAWPCTATLLSRAEVLIVPIRSLRDFPELRDALIGEIKAFAPPAAGQALPWPPEVRDEVQAAQARLITTGLTDATNLLVMDMDLCVRCGRCSMACHEVHGQSRLTRRGIAVHRLASPPAPVRQALLAPMACMHCEDPECLTGCPTGAIGRFAGGHVDINAKTCIGCGDCAVNCPYNAISMVQRTRSAPATSRRGSLMDLVQISPAPLPAAVEPSEDLMAVKCNLCTGTTLNPEGCRTPAYGCEENCPTGALARVDPQEYFEELALIQGPAYPPREAGRPNIHRADRLKRRIHLAGTILFALIAAAAYIGLRQYGFNGHIAGLFTMRWLTGLAGLIGIAGTVAYPWRRRTFRRRAGPLRYWMLGHVYLGITGAALIVLHGGTQRGGLLTAALAISFDLVILSGVWGIVCYRLIPPFLNRLESGSPLLADDLNARREELIAEFAEARAAASEPARSVIGLAVRRFASLRFLLHQFTLQEPLENLTAAARQEFNPHKAALPDSGDRVQADRAIDSLVALRRVDALRSLHGLLKSWLSPHVVASSAMLALLVLHIFQVIYGAR